MFMMMPCFKPDCQPSKACQLFWFFCLFMGVLLTCDCRADLCPPFFLRTDQGMIINPITGENAHQPFSTRQTCGTCHDYDRITRGYHFDMGWSGAGDDRFKDTDTPWLLSHGLTGNLTPVGFFQLAKKQNHCPEAIDLTAFDFVARVPKAFKGFQKPGCAACHPGGGMLEFDRNGLRYDRHLAKNPGLALTLDGDYYQSQWDKTGVIEADCLICHSRRYQLQTRIKQIKALNFKWAGTAAAGIGQVSGRVINGDTPRVTYNLRCFNQDGTFILPDMVPKPTADNCLICHATIDMSKRGTSWGDPLNPDVHHLAGLTCIDCHEGNIDHNFTKGNAMANRVRDDLDHSMRSCRDCHETGYKGAARMQHRVIRRDHLDKLSCEACHIPELNRSAIGAMYLNTGSFGKHGQINAKRFGSYQPWKPAYVRRKKDADGKQRITPVNPMYACLFTNQDTRGRYVPLFLSEVKEAFTRCRDRLSLRDHEWDFHQGPDIHLMLNTLKAQLSRNPRFDQPAPCYHNAGTLFTLDDNGSLKHRVDTSWVTRLPYFSISHNVAPKEKALGASGCSDCHSTDAHMFNGLVVTDYFGDQGRPRFMTMADFMGFSRSFQWVNKQLGKVLGVVHPVVLVYLSGINPGIALMTLALVAMFFTRKAPWR
ncbi:MAG: hypothetical protein D3926_20940 [Desulfobacteraceae bacterium]|nr:MAG: hypothetical protein D3926_20940 [Desulfobacteraceae bacterium]